MNNLAAADFYALFAPKKFFREYIEQQDRSDAGLAWRRPLFIALTVAIAGSLMATHGMSAELILSAALLWLFLPIAQVTALFTVCRNNLNSRSRAQVVDALLVSHLPWLLWLACWAAMQVWMPLPTAMKLWAFWFPPACLVALFWAGWLDFNFFRVVLGRSRKRAWLELVLYRLIAWSFFIAVAAYGAFVPALHELFK